MTAESAASSAARPWPRAAYGYYVTGVLLLAWGQWHRTRSDAARVMAGLGRISYGVYLWNYPLALWLRPHDPTGLAALVLSVLAALGSWQLWERRFAAPRREEESRGRA